FFSSRRRHTRFSRDWSSDVCSSDLRRTTTGSVLPGRGGAVLMAWTTCGVAMESGDCSEQSVLAQFLAQGAAVEAEHARGNALVAACLLHHGFQQRWLDFVEHHRVKLADQTVVDLAQVFAEGRAHAGAQRLLAAQRRRAVGLAHAASAWPAAGKSSKKASTRASCSVSVAAALKRARSSRSSPSGSRYQAKCLRAMPRPP